MSSAEETPVLVGVGQSLQRCDDPLEGSEPLELMIAALTKAGEDSGAPKLLARAESIYVLRGAWAYGNPGREVARRFGAVGAETVGTPYGGNFAQVCVLDAARSIQARRRKVILITGAENGRSQGQAQRQGLALPATEVPGAPDRMLALDKAIFHEAELARGMNSASDIFAMIESAVRYARSETLEAHTHRIASLWAGMNAVARENPNARIRKAYSADQIRTAAPDNPMISYPYTRLMNANARVDMGAGLLLCSLAEARRAQIPETKLIFPQVGTEAHDSLFASTRVDFHSSPAIRIAGTRALELAGKEITEIDHLDLYSCFPSAVEIAAAELGASEDRPLSVTGGLTFGGGPLNSYGLHAVARMAEVIRADPNSTGLISANGGWLAKHAFGIYGSTAPDGGFCYENLQDQVDAIPLRRAEVEFEGRVTIEAYTVAHRGGTADKGFAACLTDDGRRTWATVQDPGVLDAMTREEFCGRQSHLNRNGQLDLA